MTAEKRPVTSRDLWSLRFVGDPELSASGNELVWVETWIDAKKNHYESAVYIARRGEDGSFGAPARLTRKESQLLAVLQQNPGRCLSRPYLLETVWGYRNGTKTRTLDVHIQRLRRKLGPEAAGRILTVLRSGYAWLEDSTGPRSLQ